MHRFRIPELFLGCFLTVAVFSAGMLFVHLPDSHSSAQAVKQQEASSQNSRSESLDVNLTGSTWLTKDAAGFFTAGLVVVGIGQALLFFFQLNYMRKGMHDATIAARAASRSSKATVEQARIARDSLVKVQRPYVFVFGPYRLEKRRKDPLNLPPFLEYKVANYGQTPAIIKAVGAEFIVRPDGVVLAPIGVAAGHPLLTTPIIPPARVRKKLAQMLPEYLEGDDIFIDLAEEEHPDGGGYATVRLKAPEELYFRVIVYYDGPFSEGHKTSACWVYSGVTGQFVQYGGNEYNYTE